jgi:hypothetical protein
MAVGRVIVSRGVIMRVVVPVVVPVLVFMAMVVSVSVVIMSVIAVRAVDVCGFLMACAVTVFQVMQLCVQCVIHDFKRHRIECRQCPGWHAGGERGRLDSVGGRAFTQKREGFVQDRGQHRMRIGRSRVMRMVAAVVVVMMIGHG